MKTGRINNSNSFIPVILYKEQQAGPRQLTAQLYHLRDISKPLASRAWDSPRDFVRDIFWSSSSLLSPQNQNPWAMPCQASSNPPGSRGSCSKTPTSASSADTCGMLAGHRVWSQHPFQVLLGAVCARTARAITAEVFWLYLGLIWNRAETKQNKKKGEPTFTAPRDQTLLFQSTHFGGREAGDHLAI